MGIEEQIDKLIDLGEDIKSRLDLLVELASDHFAGANKMVAEEPPKKWRRLTDEFVQPGDWANAKVNRQDVDPPDEGWIPADPCYFGKMACTLSMYFARPVADETAKEPEPAWEPKVGDWVRVTRPQNWKEWKDPLWREEMHIYDGKVFEFVKWSQWSTGQRASLQGIDWFFHRDWLSPAEPPAKDKPAEEPPKKWRRLTDEFVQPGDWANAKVNRQDVDPPEGGWIPAEPCYFGKRACTLSIYFARPVVDEPAKDPEHPAGPMPDPGEGYRLLSKDPPEELAEGDEFWFQAKWYRSAWGDAYIEDQEKSLWYRRKIGFPAKEAEPEYREPVLPADVGKECEFSDDSISWEGDHLIGWRANLNTFNWESARNSYRYARIKKES